MQGTLHKHNFTQRLEQSPSGSQYTTACKVGPHMGLNERLSELSNNSSFLCSVQAQEPTQVYSILRADGEMFN